MTNTGSCQCGAVTYTVQGEPLMTYACHYRDCQKRTGSAFSMGMIIPVAQLQFDGKLVQWERTSERGVTNIRYSCAQCGNIIYGIGGDSPELAKLQPGTLDDRSQLNAEVHIWTRYMQPWMILSNGAPRFEEQPDNPMALLEVAQQYRQQLSQSQEH